jgi:hypothetical protein
VWIEISLNKVSEVKAELVVYREKMDRLKAIHHLDRVFRV